MYQHPPHTWHSETMKKMTTLTVEELEYVRDDARGAAQVADIIDNPKGGQYWDEYHYACMELHKRFLTINPLDKNDRCAII